MYDVSTFLCRYIEYFDGKNYRYSLEYHISDFCFTALELTDSDIQQVLQMSKDAIRDFPDFDHDIRVEISSCIVRQVDGVDTVFYRCLLSVNWKLPF